MTTLSEAALPEVLDKMSKRGLPALFLPRKSQFVHVAELPLLGTGKLDLRRVKEVACAADDAPAQEA